MPKRGEEHCKAVSFLSRKAEKDCSWKEYEMRVAHGVVKGLSFASNDLDPNVTEKEKETDP